MTAHDDPDVQAVALARVADLVERGKTAAESLRARCEIEAEVLRDWAAITDQTAPASGGDLETEGARQMILGAADLARTMADSLDNGLVPLRAIRRVQGRES